METQSQQNNAVELKELSEKPKEDTNEVEAQQKKKKRRIIKYLIGFAIAIATFVLLFYYFPPKDIINVFKNAKVGFILLAISMYIIALLFTTLRYFSFFKIKFPNLFVANLFSMFNSDITPGKSGFVSIVFSLKKRDITYDESTMALGVTQFLDFLIRCIIIIMAGVIIIKFFNFPIYWVALLIAITLIFLIVLFLLIYTRIITKITTRFPKRQFLQKTSLFFVNVHERAISHKKKIPLLILYSILSWIFTTLRWAFCAYALGINIPIYYALILQPIIAISAFIPFTIAGLGITETLALLILLPLGIEPGAVIALALLDRVIALIVDMFGLIELKQFLGKKKK